MKEHFIFKGKEINLNLIEDNEEYIKYDFFDLDKKSITKNIGFVAPKPFFDLNSFKDIIIKELEAKGGKHIF